MQCNHAHELYDICHHLSTLLNTLHTIHYSIHYLNLSPACITAEIKTKVHFIMQECTQLI